MQNEMSAFTMPGTYCRFCSSVPLSMKLGPIWRSAMKW